jgi:hypothetical protein
MRTKLTLNLEDLSVDTFDTTAAMKAKGTVFGEQCTCYTQCTCPGCPTCDASCNGTCGDTCPNTCAYTCDDGTCVNCGTAYDTCRFGYTCGDCTALKTNCNEVCL